MARSIFSVFGPRRGKGAPNHHDTKREAKSRQTLNGVQDDQSDARNLGEKAGMGAPLEPTARKSKRSYLCCWRIQRFPSPSPYQCERGDGSLRSDFGSLDHRSSYPARGRKSRIPDWVVRRGAPQNEPMIALRNVGPAHINSPVTQVADKVLDILIWKADDGQIRRFLVLELNADVNVMDDEVYRSLNLEKEPCDMTTPFSLPGQADLKPTGKVSCRWCVWGDSRNYLTSFLIVSGCDFDVMIGRHAIMEHQINP